MKLPDHRHHRGPPVGRVGHQLHLHRLPQQVLPRVEGQGRQRHLGQLAGRAGRQGQRGRDPAGQADRRRHRLRRADLRPVEQAAATPRSRTRPGSSSSPRWSRSPPPRPGPSSSQGHRFPGLDHQRARGRGLSDRLVHLAAGAEGQQGCGQGQADQGLPDLDDHARGPEDGRGAELRAAAGRGRHAGAGSAADAEGRRQGDRRATDCRSAVALPAHDAGRLRLASCACSSSRRLPGGHGRIRQLRWSLLLGLRPRISRARRAGRQPGQPPTRARPSPAPAPPSPIRSTPSGSTPTTRRPASGSTTSRSAPAAASASSPRARWTSAPPTGR